MKKRSARMLRNPLSMVMLVLGLLIGLSSPADAAKLTIGYQIVDGSMDFPFSNPSNPVSGNIRITIEGTGTTGSFFPASGPATLVSFTALTSGGGSIGLVPSLIGDHTGSGDLMFSGSGLGSLLSGEMTAHFNLSSGTIFGTLFGTSIGSSYSFGTLTFIGQEISRILVPEPTVPLFAGCVVIGVLGLLAFHRLR